MIALVTGALLALLGVVVTAGGAWLAVVGGTWAYIALGLGLVVTGALLAVRRAVALHVYAVLLVAVLGWSLWEVGLDRWALVPRGALLALIGVWLLTPWVGHFRWRGPRGVLGGAMLLVIATTLASMVSDPLQIAGRLPAASNNVQAALAGAAPVAADDWTAYGGNGYGQRYSALTDITVDNVNRLEEAWRFNTGDRRDADDPAESTFEVTPLEVDGTLYVCTPHSVVIALDSATGRARWRFDPQVRVDHSSQHATCRGVAYHQANEPGAGRCARRVLLPTIDARLIALDAATGERCADFGDNGVVDLNANMPPQARLASYMQTSPPAVARNLVIVGGSINDNLVVGDNPSGVIRAYAVNSGQLVWNWDPGNPDQTAPLPPGRHYTPGSPNNWSVASVDEKLGMVYVPLGNQSPDQIGMSRSAAVERFTASIVALDLATGQLRWVFQTVHHDLWDRDVPAQPVLVDLSYGGETVPALVAATKQGDIYVLDRRNGKPLLPVREVAVPESSLAGEKAAPTQPTSALSFMPPPLREKDMWGATPVDQLFCRIRFRSMAYAGPYTPPSTQPTLVYPGNFGVFNWGSVAVDATRQVVIGTPARLAFTYRLVPREDSQATLVSKGSDEHWNENFGGRYAVEIGPFVSPLGLPCQAPPWGLRAAADLRTGEIVWRHRNGTVRDQMPGLLPIPLPMGVASLGGPLVTAGGVVFHSGTMDYYLRAYDVATGREVWKARLPAGGQATPMTYRVNGKQMVVVAAGGHGSFGTKIGDAIIAYALR